VFLLAKLEVVLKKCCGPISYLTLSPKLLSHLLSETSFPFNEVALIRTGIYELNLSCHFELSF